MNIVIKITLGVAAAFIIKKAANKILIHNIKKSINDIPDDVWDDVMKKA